MLTDYVEHAGIEILIILLHKAFSQAVLIEALVTDYGFIFDAEALSEKRGGP